MKNKLDGREYAVKKVPLKETDPDLCLKVQRKDGNPNCFDMPCYPTCTIMYCILQVTRWHSVGIYLLYVNPPNPRLHYLRDLWFILF